MNPAQPEEEEEEEEEGDGSEEEEGDMEMPPEKEEEEVVAVAATTAVAQERGTEALTDPALTGCLPTGDKLEGGSASGHPDWEQSLNPELQQGYRILSEFLLEKHRPLTAPFLRSWENQKTERGQTGADDFSAEENSGCLLPCPKSQQLSGMWLLKMEEKFTSGQYRGITDFVADFRLMLETCYRLHGVDHWLSKQAQKLEMMLEQKLALLSRHLREKTAIAVTSKGFYGLEDEKGTACTSTRRRSTPRSLAGLTTGAFESVMVQVLRQEEQLRAKEEKRLREQERKEAEEASQKEVEEWEKFLLSQAAPTQMENMWEIPAIGHFLCLAQHILNLPEIVFYELERCLLMPQCSPFLSKIMTSLLSPPHRRSTLHRRPSFPYRTWEAALRQKVQQWYTVVGQTDNPDSCAEKLGLCPQFFTVLGEVSPLEEKPFHELPFCQKVWLLKGLCDSVYETQKDVQDAVLGQPIHECREVILGYDYLENAYVHFPQFCGADVRIYKQKPFHAPEFPIPPIKVKRVPRIKLEKVKCEYGTKSNGEMRFDAKELLPHAKQEPGKNLCLAKVHLNLLNVIPEHEIKYNCEEKARKDCDFTKDCCKENQDKGIVSEDGLGEPLSPGEIRILENKEKCGESSVVKIEAIPLKENTLKTCQMHLNGNQTDNPDFNCHKVAKEVTSKNLVEQKTLMFSKIRAKKKKKKKKKLKDILNESLQRKREIHLHSLKSYKPEIQNKLLMIKKKAKHKKHKSGKKSISKKAVTKKRKSITKPVVPEFQLICTNLDELRELIRKTENELKDIEHIKKKSGRWYHRKQAVKELHCTLIRLLNELLPWEPKLMKAFHRNRSRLKKDYDDFRRQPDHDKFIREQWTNEDSEINIVKEVSSTFTSETSEHTEFFKRDYLDAEDMNSPEMDLGTGKSRPLRKDLTCREMQKIVPKSVKRQSRQNYYLDDSTNDFLPRKKLKLSTNDATVHSIENDLSTEGCLNRQIESSASESLDITDSTAYVPHLIKGTKPIQALLAKNIGNKVALTSQLPSTVGRSTFTSEKLIISTISSSPIKPELPCQTSSKSSLQVLYKMPAGHCMPVDLHNNSVKIQMQPVVDVKSGEKNTGEKIMQQVLILPKNFLIQHRESKNGAKENQPLQQNTMEQHCISLPQSTDTNTTLVPSIPASSINAATTLLPNTNVKKNIIQLPQEPDSVNRISLLPSVTSTSNTLASVVKMNQSETVKITKTVVSAAASPVALPIVSSAIQTLTTVSQSVTSYTNSSPQNTADSETKQELKTICIRDSQSILVRTRGGNTGIVKVQTNSEPISASSFSPSSVFTYAPQLQAFLMPKSTQLSTSTVSAVTKAIPSFPTLAQMSPATSSIPTISSCANPKKGKNTTVTFGQFHNSGVNQGVSKTLHGSASPFLSSMSSNIVMTTPPNSSGNAVSLSIENVGQSSTCTTQTSFINQQINVNNGKYSVAQPDVTSITSRGLGSAQVQKLMLVTNPSLLPVCGTTGVNLIPTPASTGVSTQKLVFINTPLASIQSNANVTTEPLKQTFPPSIGKAYVKSTEKPQLILLPTTVGSSLKINTSPTVSQVKDVKIGLNIGQAFINSTGNVQNVSTVNIMQSTAPKDLEDKNNHNVIFPLSTSSSVVPVCSSLACQNIAAKAVNTTIVTSSQCLNPTSVALSGATTGTQPTILAGGMEPPAKIIPVLTTRLPSSNVGSTVAISTVKTGHLASSVLISTAQPTVSHSSLSSAFQLPVTVSLSGPVNGVPKMLHTVPQLPAIPPTSQCVPHSKSQQSTKLAQFQPTGISAGVPTNGSTQKLQKASPNASKVINVSNLVPLPCPSVPLNVKPVSAFSCAPGTSTIQAVPSSPSIVNNVSSQLNESHIQQKIIINTCTPLAPGTQIMISGTRFVVPSQGLGAGSHVLLISANPKIGPLLTVSNGHGLSFAAPTPQKTTQVMGNSLSWQPSKLPLKSSTKIVNSLGIANPVPIVRATPQIIANTSKSGTPSFTTLSTSLVMVTSSSTQTKTTLAPATHTSISQLQNSKSALHLDTSIKKLMVSPEGAILNAIKTPTSETSSLSSSFSADLISTTKNSAVVFPNFLNSSIGVPDTAAS
ncbi:uncharacterized protein KIAA2026 homolog isoform X1 [Notechis scutatus]|uniref:Uncharacterized protein KIAA2026 homolog isoform X1 n=1 Tax=Notechis scutatus TaxID=8663 RepID=A0A6J1ULG5_9SAUR|nr:uncharacterized protein KIAA2026 homolog isoform X1 [Notechis scutatus]